MASSRTPFSAEKKGVAEILREAPLRWFRTEELCKILANCRELGIFISPGQEKPQVSDGLLFAIKEEMLKDFRRDGINWAKKPANEKAVQEGHEKLKVKGHEKLDGYYASEREGNLKRHIYRMVRNGKQHSDTVLFHYREVKENRGNRKCSKKTEENPPSGLADQLAMPYAELEDMHMYSRQEIEEVSNLPYPGAPGSSSALLEMYHHIDNEDRGADFW